MQNLKIPIKNKENVEHFKSPGNNKKVISDSGKLLKFSLIANILVGIDQ